MRRITLISLVFSLISLAADPPLPIFSYGDSYLSGCGTDSNEDKCIGPFLRRNAVFGVRRRAFVAQFHGFYGGQVWVTEGGQKKLVSLDYLAQIIKERVKPGQPIYLQICHAAEDGPFGERSTLKILSEKLPGHVLIAGSGKVELTLPHGIPVAQNGFQYHYTGTGLRLDGSYGPVTLTGDLSDDETLKLLYVDENQLNKPGRIGNRFYVDAEGRTSVVHDADTAKAPGTTPPPNTDGLPSFGGRPPAPACTTKPNLVTALPKFKNGTTVQRVRLTYKGATSATFHDFGRRLGSNGSAGLGFLGGKICAFGQRLAQDKYNETLFLLDEYVFALTGGAYEARLTSLYPGDMYRCHAEGVQLRPYCPSGEGVWTWAKSGNITLIQPVDLEKKFLGITTQTLGSGAIVAQPEDDRRLENGIQIYRSRVDVEAEDPDAPGKTFKTWIWDVGWKVPTTPFTAPDGTTIDPRAIDRTDLEPDEEYFFDGFDRGYAKIPNGMLQALANAKRECTGGCAPIAVTIDDIREVWADIYRRQQQKKADQAQAAIASDCERFHTRLREHWQSLLGHVSCPPDWEKDRSDIEASIDALASDMAGLRQVCPPERIAALNRSHGSFFAAYRNAYEAAKASPDFKKGFADALYASCDELTACETSVRAMTGFTAEQESDGTLVLRREPGATLNAFALMANADGRFFKTGSSPALQSQCRGDDGTFALRSSNREATSCEEMFPEKDFHGDLWSQLVIADMDKLCGETITLDVEARTYNKKTRCTPVKVRFECDPPPAPEYCYCEEPDPYPSYPSESIYNMSCGTPWFAGPSLSLENIYLDPAMTIDPLSGGMSIDTSYSTLTTSTSQVYGPPEPPATSTLLSTSNLTTLWSSTTYWLTEYFGTVWTGTTVTVSTTTPTETPTETPTPTDTPTPTATPTETPSPTETPTTVPSLAPSDSADTLLRTYAH